MRITGIITRVVSERKFFFIDKDYFCHYNDINFEPVEGQEVEYERSKNKDGKGVALNVIKIKGFLENYFEELTIGYFDTNNKIRKEFLVEYPIRLAEIFSAEKGRELNKVTQIMKWFIYCRAVEGKFKMNRDFDDVRTSLFKLYSYLNDAVGRKRISVGFKTFLEKNIELASKDIDNFLKGFIMHFEAFIGFYRNKKGD